ncbi:GEL complex subunit OPTI [Planococcus citri]|uniref:GEL complex subunit OPTI n=1 Tax=Planococcus citri TaxID=170843 RepID=UPI0031F7F4AB
MNKNHHRAQQKLLKEKKPEQSVLRKAFTKCSQWDDKDEFLDVIYWSRQIIGIVAGIVWGLIPLKGFFGIALFVAVNAGLLYLYFTNFQKIDEEEYGGSWELTKEGFMSSFAGFLVMWIIIYTGVHHT